MSDLYVYVMVSRKKDNENVEGFKKRHRTIVEYKKNESKRVFEEFLKFVNNGVDGENSRLYRTVNSRNENKVLEELAIRLIKEKPNVTKVKKLVASIAHQVSNRDESKWMFDFDVDDSNLMNAFVEDIGLEGGEIEVYKTPNGYTIITEHGFDTRELFEKYKDYDISLDRDGMLFRHMIKKGIIDKK